MASQDEVRRFLNDFKVKMSVFSILFRDERPKNSQDLLNLEITPASRTETIKDLEVEDYCEGPLDDSLFGIASMWVFGKNIKRQEVYIKVSMGRPNSKVICISFHKAAHPMRYPFKK
jgi:hypothetical protein